MERREDLSPGTFRGNPRDLGDDEVRGPEAFLRDNPFLDLAHFSGRELRFRPEEDRADPRLPFAASIRHPLEIVARHVDRPIPIGQAKLVGGEDQVAGHRLVDRDAAAHPLAQDLVEQVRLVPVDEHEEEIERKLLQRADVIPGTGRQMIQDRLLETVRFRVRSEGGVDVARVAQGSADLIRFGTLALDGIRDVRVDSLLKLAPHDMPADDVGDGSHGTETLQAKEIREAAERTDLAGGLFGNRTRPTLRDREIPDDDLEAVSGEISDLKRTL